MGDLSSEFDAAMLSIYQNALDQTGYRATRFLQLVQDNGGVSAATQLLQSPTHPEGLTKLWEMGRLDLSMECLVLDSQWSELFDEESLKVARKRLEDLNYHCD